MADAGDNGRGLSAGDQELLDALTILPPRTLRASARLLRSILFYCRALDRLKRDAARCHNFDVAALLAADAAKLSGGMAKGLSA